ncbi:cytochrome c, partial [Methylobacterium nigriterrae]|uniref:cytochrome c n=1 Tax=Methylobacterium nigriterrae TaxID=3127512 RepID=UPI003013ED46
MTRQLSLIAAAALALAGGAALAAPRGYDLPEATAQLRPAEGHEAGYAAAQANCVACHSVDYIAMQPPKKGKAFWDAEVTKMIKVY